MNKTKILACRTLEEEITEILPENIDGEFLEYGLHDTPDKLRQELQRCIEKSSQHDTLLLGYGLCSNGVAGLKSDKHRIIIPRVHDCISLLLGSRKRYEEEFKQHPGTFYLSKGWIKQKADPLANFYKNREKYGEKEAHGIAAEVYKNYERVVYIHTGIHNEESVKYSREVAEFLNVKFLEMEGSLYYFKQLVKGSWSEDFLVIPPGENVTIYDFL